MVRPGGLSLSERLDTTDFEAIRPFATQRQAEVLDAIIENGSVRAAAKHLGRTRATVQGSVRKLRRFAALRGVAPAHDMVHSAPDPFIVKGVSTYYNKEGVRAGQWVKTSADVDRVREAMFAAVSALADDVVPLPPVAAPSSVSASLLTQYTMTDCHVGMMAWGVECGDDWDLKIAERVLVACFDRLVASSPDADTAIVCNLGDFLHFDSLAPVTPTHGHLLDADSRFQKVIEVAVRVLRELVRLALRKHRLVIVIMGEGNHDMASSAWLRVLFKALFENEPRVEVLDSPLPYYVHQHGKTMIGFHHGHLRKKDALPLLMAAQFPEVWGSTKYRYVHTGHQHHVDEKEHSGITVLQHPTLAARDAHAARGGWIADRQASAITYHSEFGQVGRVIVTPEMVRE